MAVSCTVITSFSAKGNNQQGPGQVNVVKCYVYTTEQLHGCAPFLVHGASACTGSLCTPNSTCAAGTRGFEIDDDDYWNMYQGYAPNDTDPDRSGIAAPITIKCTLSGSCFCKRAADGRWKCYMNLRTARSKTRHYYPLGGPCDKNPLPPPGSAEPGNGPEVVDQDIP